MLKKMMLVLMTIKKHQVSDASFIQIVAGDKSQKFFDYRKAVAPRNSKVLPNRKAVLGPKQYFLKIVINEKFLKNIIFRKFLILRIFLE